ncbi:MAG: hypothetical protein COV70_02250 [Parcubacteria group bacterium CG11_big_fil_rev_8_21_14_0_20_39_22]|nr:MAG: hypothetical protein COV70_02250 [Parcubacteria group bacterium CG11_big_fil_rev_8_21_14_0_20_39_22]
MVKKEILGLIPARGGSKSIPKKNLSMLNNKPLISYAINALKNSNLVSRLMVTTDDEEIASVSKKFGAEVPFLRPSHLAQDTSRVLDALQYTLKRLKDENNYVPDYIVTVQPTSPLVKSSQIDSAISLAVEKNAESVITVEELTHRHHPHNIRGITQEETIGFWMEKEHYSVMNRQQRPKFYAFGNLYVSSFNLLHDQGLLEGKNNFHIEIDPISAIDIDNHIDVLMVESLMNSGVTDNEKNNIL